MNSHSLISSFILNFATGALCPYDLIPSTKFSGIALGKVMDEAPLAMLVHLRNESKMAHVTIVMWMVETDRDQQHGLIEACFLGSHW